MSGNTKFGRFGMTMTGFTYQDIRRNLTSRTERSTFGTNANNLLQQGIYSYVGEYTAANIAMSYEIDSLQLLGSNLNLFKSWYGDRTSKIAALYDGVGQLQQYHEFTDVNPQHQSGVGFDINYQLGFKNHRERLFTLSYQYSNTPNRDRNDVLITNAYNYGQSNYIQQNANGTNEQTAQADYVHPFKKAVFEGGIKAIFRHNFSDYERSVETAGSYVPEPLLSDHFDYHQRVMSLYSSLQLQFTAIEIKAGIRLEHTSLDGNFSAAQTRINQDYYNFIPVVSLQRKLGASIVNLGYAQRILRPGIYQINPYINNSDPLFVSTGNPDLRPVVNRSVELSYTGSRKGNYNISVVYSFANNSVQKLTDVRDGISYTSYQNIGKNRNLGLNASISFAFSKRLNASLNTQLSYLWIDGNINGLRVTNNGIEGYAYGTIGYKLAETWRANSSVSFNSSSVLLQGGTNGRVNNTYRLTKELFKKKLQLAASVSNPWARYRYNRTTTVGDAFSQLVTGQKDYRMYMINLNYNFGQLKGQVKKNKRKIDNDDRLAN